MKISLKWLQKYFDEPLPDAKTMTEAFTFHSFEVEEQDNKIFDLDILPDRAGYALSHRGIAYELSASLGVPMKEDPLRTPLLEYPKSDTFSVDVKDTKKCHRYIGAFVRGVKVGSSPVWLKEALETVGQRSINNIVDATNYVMLNMGQPLHAFDAEKLEKKDGAYKITVRTASEGENITTLSGDDYVLPEGILLVTDGNSEKPLGVAGIKGGALAEVTSDTTDLVVESASFDGETIRRATKKLKLFTDASLRFQNKPSAELAVYGMRDILNLIIEIAGGEVVCVDDVYTAPVSPATVSIPLEKINNILGTSFTKEDVKDVFKRLDFSFTCEDSVFTVIPPFERTDISIPEDLVEEVARTVGYDSILPVLLPETSTMPDQAHFRGVARVKDFLIERGFTEISTQSFAKKGDIILANPLDKTKPALRRTLAKNMELALVQAKQYTPRTLGPSAKPKLFEIGNIFPKDGERIVVETSETVSDLPEIIDDAEYTPVRYTLGKYKPFSIYPFILRDIAVWTPKGTESVEVVALIRANAGELLVRVDQFDSFEKDNRVSYAFRMVFEAEGRTLTDTEINTYMEEITKALNAQTGYEVR